MITNFGVYRAFMPRFLWNIGQPIVTGHFYDVINYVIAERSGEYRRELEAIYELPNCKKLTKKELKEMVTNVCPELYDKCKELHII